MAKDTKPEPASEAWTAPDPKGLTERKRYEALVKLLDGAKPDTRHAVVRWVVAAELDGARDAYKQAHDADETYKAKLLRLAGVSTKRAAESLAEHQYGLELAVEVSALAVRVSTSLDMAGEGLVKALAQLQTLAGPWKDARAGAERGHGVEGIDDKPERVARLRDEARVLHERWSERQKEATAKKR